AQPGSDRVALPTGNHFVPELEDIGAAFTGRAHHRLIPRWPCLRRTGNDVKLGLIKPIDHGLVRIHDAVSPPTNRLQNGTTALSAPHRGTTRAHILRGRAALLRSA